jgi:hypothetical protein
MSKYPLGTSGADRQPGGLFPGSGQGDRAPATTPKVPPAHRRGSFDKNVNPQNMHGQGEDMLDKYGEL